MISECGQKCQRVGVISLRGDDVMMCNYDVMCNDDAMMCNVDAWTQ